MTLALIDFGAGNLRSVHNALVAAGADDVVITDNAAKVRAAERIVLPGVGAFGACAAALRALPGMIEALDEKVIGDATPFLGICVGMQLMATRGEELGAHIGLGWFDGVVRRIEPGTMAAKVPHMGWNDVAPRAPHPVIVPGEAYFLHSFAYDGVGVIAATEHGETPITAAIARDNLLGVQFHPEKSQRYGIAMLERFLAWQP